MRLAALNVRASKLRPFNRLVLVTKRNRRHKFVHLEVIRWMQEKEEERQEFKGTKYYNL